MSCSYPTAAQDVCFEGPLAGLAATETGNGLSQSKLQFTPLMIAQLKLLSHLTGIFGTCDVTSHRSALTDTRCTWPPTRPPTSTRSPRTPRRSRWCTTRSRCPGASLASSAWCNGPMSRVGVAYSYDQILKRLHLRLREYRAFLFRTCSFYPRIF